MCNGINSVMLRSSCFFRVCSLFNHDLSHIYPLFGKLPLPRVPHCRGQFPIFFFFKINHFTLFFLLHIFYSIYFFFFLSFFFFFLIFILLNFFLSDEFLKKLIFSFLFFYYYFLYVILYLKNYIFFKLHIQKLLQQV